MRDHFSEDEISDYRRNGFLGVPDFLDTDDLAGWRDVVDTAVRERRDRPTGKNSEKAFTQRMHLRRSSDAVRLLVDDPRIAELVAQLEDLDSVRLYLDQALVKEPYGSPTQFHLDIPWWGFDSAHACTLWVALDDATLENGCLYFVPGSHRRRLNTQGDLGSEHGALFVAHPEAAAPAVPSPLPAGGASFHNGHTIHGAGVNMTPGRRRAMTVAFMPGDVTYNGTRDTQVLGEEYLDTLEPGDPLANADLLPLLHGR